jgi:hypothetical protein
MRSLVSSSLLASVSLLATLLAVGCAASADGTDEDSSDLSAAHPIVTGAKASVLDDLLAKAKAPSTTPAGLVGVGSHAARVNLATAQGGIAHFISENLHVSTLDGEHLADLGDLQVSWSDVRDALMAGGAKFTTTDGAHGASSSEMFVKVECKQVVSPTARPSCTVTPITMTQADSNVLMHALQAVNAPSNTAPGITGVGSRIAQFEVDTAQGGIAHFISESGEITTLDGKSLGSLIDANVAWVDVRDALLRGGASFDVTKGLNGASSSKMSATVECTQVVSPTAKPGCTVRASM